MLTFPDSPFRLAQAFPPAGDQPEAIDKLVEGIRDGLSYQTLLGVTGSGKTFTMANVLAGGDRGPRGDAERRKRARIKAGRLPRGGRRPRGVPRRELGDGAAHRASRRRGREPDAVRPADRACEPAGAALHGLSVEP